MVKIESLTARIERLCDRSCILLLMMPFVVGLANATPTDLKAEAKHFDRAAKLLPMMPSGGVQTRVWVQNYLFGGLSGFVADRHGIRAYTGKLEYTDRVIFKQPLKRVGVKRDLKAEDLGQR